MEKLPQTDCPYSEEQLFRMHRITEDDLKNLNDAQRLYLLQCLTELATTGESITASSLFMEDYRWMPVSMQQFIEDDEYMGKFSKGFYPTVRNLLIDIFDHPPQPNDVLLGGAIGTGKSVSAAVAMLYSVYRMTCLRNPHAYYGLQTGNNLYGAVYSIDLDQALQGVYGRILNWTDQVPYFQRRCPRVKRINSSIKFSSSPVEVIFASRVNHVIGKDVFCLPRGARVVTLHGIREVENITPEDLVASPYGYATCSGSISRGLKPCYHVYADQKRRTLITASEGHKIRIQRGAGHVWVPIEQLRPGDPVLLYATGERRTITTCPVFCVEPAGTYECFDILDVADEHAYLTYNGVCNHNCACLDEINYTTAHHGMTGDQVAEAIYTNVMQRMKSRFTRKGKLNTLLISVCSRTSKQSFFEKKCKELHRELANGAAKLYAYSQWAAKPAGTFSDKTFEVEIGDKIFPSRILASGETAREGAETIRVPEDFLSEFQRDIDKSLRDLAGIATEGVLPLFRDKAPIHACAVSHQVHPFSREQCTLDITNDVGLDAYFVPERMFHIVNSKYTLKTNPHVPRFIGLDLGVTGDSLGMSMCHLDGLRTVKRYRNDGTHYFDKAPVCAFDLVLRVNPPHGSEIDLEKIRAFVLSLRDYGVHIEAIACDTSNSRDMLQIFKKLGFNTVSQSVDRNDLPYLAFRQGIVEQRVLYYNYPPLITELSTLERNIDTRKVDHPFEGTKDVADSACQAYFAASTSKMTLLPKRGFDDKLWRNRARPAVDVGSGEALWSDLDQAAKDS